MITIYIDILQSADFILLFSGMFELNSPHIEFTKQRLEAEYFNNYIVAG